MKKGLLLSRLKKFRMNAKQAWPEQEQLTNVTVSRLRAWEATAVTLFWLRWQTEGEKSFWRKHHKLLRMSE